MKTTIIKTTGVVLTVLFGFRTLAQEEIVITSVCSRHPVIQERILFKASKTDCTQVTREELNAITFMNELRVKEGTLQSEDFSGLFSLESLNLYFYNDGYFEEGLFGELSHLKVLTFEVHKMNNRNISPILLIPLISLKKLKMNLGYDVQTLPAYMFFSMASLEELDLSSHNFSHWPDGIFAGLPSLKKLDLGNDLSRPDDPLETLPEGIFSGLSSLEWLRLKRNGLRSLPESIFQGLFSLKTLILEINGLGHLPVGLFAGLSSLEILNLSINLLKTLPVGLFSDLSSLKEINLEHNSIAYLPEGFFEGISDLHELNLNYNCFPKKEQGRIIQEVRSLFPGLKFFGRPTYYSKEQCNPDPPNSEKAWPG